jgi:transcription termination factor Rho
VADITHLNINLKRKNLMNIVELKEKKISELTQMAKQYKIEGAAGMRKQELMFALLQHQIEKNGFIFGEGTLEILPDGFGFLRSDRMTFMCRPPRFGALI